MQTRLRIVYLLCRQPLQLQKELDGSGSGWGQGFPGGSRGKEHACQCRRHKILGSGRSPGGGRGTPLQYSCLENPLDRGAGQAAVPEVTNSLTRLKRLSTHAGGGRIWQNLTAVILPPFLCPFKHFDSYLSSLQPLSTCPPTSSLGSDLLKLDSVSALTICCWVRGGMPCVCRREQGLFQSLFICSLGRGS